MQLFKTNTFRVIITALLATGLGLTTHIVLLKFTNPFVGGLVQGHQFPTASQYNHSVMIWAYITAFEQIAVTIAVYYFVGGLIRCNRVLKILLLSFVYMELNGNLIRAIVMNYLVAKQAGLAAPWYFAFLVQSNQIAASVLIVVALVFICPTKQYRLNTAR